MKDLLPNEEVGLLRLIDCTKYAVFFPNIWEDMNILPDKYIKISQECNEEVQWFEKMEPRLLLADQSSNVLVE